jgi:Mg2+/Co2+ transporter CorB
LSIDFLLGVVSSDTILSLLDIISPLVVVVDMPYRSTVEVVRVEVLRRNDDDDEVVDEEFRFVVVVATSFLSLLRRRDEPPSADDPM